MNWLEKVEKNGQKWYNRGKMKEKIHSDFKKYAKAHPPLGRAVLPLIRFYGKRLFAREKSGDGVRVDKYLIPTFDGKEISAILYSPSKERKETLPCLIYFHGGGYSLPAGKYHYLLARAYAKEAECKVLFVNYRLAPKHKFPVPVNDCFSAYGYALQNAELLGIDGNKIVVGGDSAGGALAAAVTLKAEENGISLPRAQLLVYPACGPFFETPSAVTHKHAPMCSEKDFQRFMRLYLKKGEKESVYLTPVLGINADTPPTYVETAEFDFLRSCGEEYVKRLEENGVEYSFKQTEKTIHAYDMAFDSPITKQSIAARVEFLKGIFQKGERKD